MSDDGIVVGVLDAPTTGVVGPTDSVEFPDTGIALDWAIYTDEWRAPVPATVRRHAIDGMPVVESRVAVRGGDVVHRVYAVQGPPPSIVVEMENASPEPVGVKLSIGGVAAGEVATLVRAAPRWREEASDADATSLVWPLPHRATVRALVPLSARDPGAIDPARQPSAADVVRGWAALLDRGAHLDLDDEALVRAVDGARAALLLGAGSVRPRPTAEELIALEDWGFDREALTMWDQLSLWERRRAARRAPQPDAWMRAKRALADAPGGVPAAPASFLRAIHDVVLAETDKSGRAVALFPGFPAEWLGRAVALHDAPTRHGAVSCALRWHGARPALLWSAPPGTTVTAPALDPGWSNDATEGEMLLSAPPDQLFRLSTASRDGDALEEPGSFT